MNEKDKTTQGEKPTQRKRGDALVVISIIFTGISSIMASNTGIISPLAAIAFVLLLVYLIRKLNLKII